MRTLQSVNRPLLELFQSDLGRRWDIVEIQAMRVVLLLERRRCELLLSWVQVGPPLGVNSMKILSYHVALTRLLHELAVLLNRRSINPYPLS